MAYWSQKKIAQHFDIKPKTFAKYVEEYQIPHIAFGTRKKFDPQTVERYLLSLDRPRPSITKFTPIRRDTPTSSRFAELVGL